MLARAVLSFAFVVGLGGGAALAADPVEGTWLSPPDHKGQTGHVVITPCGAAFCGTLVRAYSSKGQRVTTPNVGKQLLFNMKPAGGNAYKGQAFVPIFGRKVNGELRLSGNTLKVTGRVLGIPKSQTWKRVK